MTSMFESGAPGRTRTDTHKALASKTSVATNYTTGASADNLSYYTPTARARLWLRGTESHRRSSGYEPDEILLLHPAVVFTLVVP